MKNIIIVLLISITSLYSESFFKDDDETRTDQFEIEHNFIDKTSELKKYDLENDITSNVEGSTKTNTIDERGKSKWSETIDPRSGADLQKLNEHMQKNMSVQGNTLSNKLMESIGRNIDASNTNSYSKTTVLGDTEDTAEKKAVQTMDDFYTAAKSMIANLKTVSCYVTRKLVNSYYCPLPNKDNSYFVGGGVKDSKEVSKETCEGYCSESSTCLSKEMNKDINVIETHDVEVLSGVSFEIDSDDTMIGRFIQLDFNSLYLYDDAIPVNSGTYDEEKAKEKIKSRTRALRFDIDRYNTEKSIYEKYIQAKEVIINDVHSSIKIYIDSIRTNKYKITFYNPYVKKESSTNSNNIVEEDDPKLTVKLAKSKLEYTSNKWWFCAATHLVQDIADCKGTVENLNLNGTFYNVCVTSENQQLEPTYGAFYTEEACTSKCKITSECSPTYRHLSGYNSETLPSEFKDIEIGCVDTPENTSCTKEICEQFFVNDTTPIEEKIWTKDDLIKITVLNGVEQSDVTRPRVNISEGLTANDNPALRDITTVKEMSELSFMSMIKEETFNVSSNLIGEAVPTKYAYSSLKNGDGSEKIYMELKPNSFHVDDDKDYYIYSVYVIETIFRPVYGVYQVNNRITSGEIDKQLMVMDKTYLLKTPSEYIIFKKTHDAKNRLPYTECIDEDCETSYRWQKVEAYFKDINQMYINNQYVTYDLTSDAEYLEKKKFSSNLKWETFLMHNKTSELSLIPGLIIKSQQAISHGNYKRNYTGLPVEGESSVIHNVEIHAVYSDKKLSYEEILSKLSTDNIFYSLTGKHTKIIQNDGEYATDKVKFFMHGKPNKMSVNVDFKPSAKEEGKRGFIYMMLFDEEN